MFKSDLVLIGNLFFSYLSLTSTLLRSHHVHHIQQQIWGKVICMERNRRIAKAYSRVPVLTISGSEDGFDGYKIGLNGFDNPMRDALTKTVKRHIGKVGKMHRKLAVHSDVQARLRLI